MCKRGCTQWRSLLDASGRTSINKEYRVRGDLTVDPSLRP